MDTRDEGVILKFPTLTTESGEERADDWHSDGGDTLASRLSDAFVGIEAATVKLATGATLLYSTKPIRISAFDEVEEPKVETNLAIAPPADSRVRRMFFSILETAIVRVILTGPSSTNKASEIGRCARVRPSQCRTLLANLVDRDILDSGRSGYEFREGVREWLATWFDLPDAEPTE